MFIPCWPARLTSMPSAGAFGEQLGIAPDRCYADYQTLFREEAQRPDGIEVVSVTTRTIPISPSPKRRWRRTPRYLRKALCFTAEEARAGGSEQKQNKIVGVTYGYAGYQMIQQARQMIADGLLGEIRIVNMHSPTASIIRPSSCRQNPPAGE